MQSITEMTEFLLSKGISSTWEYKKDHNGSFYVFTFEKSLSKCEIKLPEYTIYTNVKYICELVIKFLEECDYIIVST